MIVKAQIVVNASHESGKVEDAEVHCSNALLDQVGFHFGACRHADWEVELREG